MRKRPIIIRFSGEETDLDKIRQIFTEIKNLYPDDIVMAIPYEVDVLFDCSTAQLYDLKKLIEQAITMKEAANGE